MTALRLTSRDLDHLRAAQKALLSPLEREDATEWQLRANHAVRRFLGADHSVFSLPRDMVPEVMTDDTFPSQFHSYCIGLFGGEYRFRDSCVQKAVAVRRAGGTGACHERMFFRWEEARRSPAYHELFRTCRSRRLIRAYRSSRNRFRWISLRLLRLRIRRCSRSASAKTLSSRLSEEERRMLSRGRRICSSSCRWALRSSSRFLRTAGSLISPRLAATGSRWAFWSR